MMALVGLLLVVCLSACSAPGQPPEQPSNQPSDQAAAGDAGATGTTTAAGDASDATPTTATTPGSSTPPAREIAIGTMPTEDFLPLWVAANEGLFAQKGIQVRVETFQSAQELSTALASDAIDFAMTDPMVTAALVQGGTALTMHWVTLGASAEQGRFGIMANPDSGVRTLKDLAGKPIGVGSNTILEYVMDQLMLEAGLSSEQIVAEEIKKIPVRYEMMTSGQVPAAALPGSLLVLGEASGMVLVADDSKGRNLSQSVLIARDAFTDTAEGQVAVELLREIWDEAAAKVNANPDAYRALLIEKTLAAMPPSVQEGYPVSDYPMAAKPSSAMIDPVLTWMLDKGYLTEPLSYDPATGSLSKAPGSSD
jgi:NitT/TauT family transport system substrate-binding protein